jgi:glycosyltransferase involved in cell wall biosynthesis
VPYCEIQRHFDKAKIFVNTSSHEGVPNTFIHAGLGRAAIVSLEIDPDGMFGRFPAGFLAHGDTAALADAVGRLLHDPEALSAAVAGSAQFLTEWHDNERNVDAFLRGVGAA